MLLWAINIHAPIIKQEFDTYLKRLPTPEQTRINRFVHRKDAISCLVGQIMIRKAISTIHPSIQWDQISIQRTKNGRPFVSFPKCDFNQSHHGDWVVVCLSIENRVGIDITQLQPNITLDSFQNVFSNPEWLFIHEIENDAEQMKRFSCLWVLKEAFVKYAGCGIVVDLKLISFQLLDTIQREQYQCHVWDQPKSIVLHLNAKEWKSQYDEWTVKDIPLFCVQMVDTNHIMAYCSNAKEESQLEFKSFTTFS
jgi:4'-phosphopantetheinyl transferase